MSQVGLSASLQSLTSQNTCKTCAYGMGGTDGALTNEAGDRIQLCKKSVQAQLTDIQAPINPDFLTKTPISKLKLLSPKLLERLGRLDHILYKTKGSTHFEIISQEEAYTKISSRFLSIEPNRSFFYSSGRSSNEASFVLHLFARLYGTNNVNNCSYYCHQASGVGMGKLLGTSTATLGLSDLKYADLIFVIGANPSSNHPRFLTELLECRRRGGHVIVINPAVEPGLVRFSVPSDLKSMLSGGTELASHYITPHIGHDIHVLTAIAHACLDASAADLEFIHRYTQNFEAYQSAVLSQNFNDLCKQAGVDTESIRTVANLYSRSKNVVFTWAMGITHHEHGVQNVEAITGLAMLRGMLGRPHAGLLPLRGHSNVQGVGSVGVTPKLKDLIFQNIEKYLKVKLPETPGWDTMACMEKAADGEVDLAWIQGGNLYASNPDLVYAESALNEIKTKIYLTTTLNQGHVIPSEGEVFILPVLARDEEIQSTTQESMFNYVRMSKGGFKRLRNARSETEMIVNIANMVVDETIFDFSAFVQHQSIRKAMSEIIPGFAGIAAIEEAGKGFTIEGRVKHQPEFDTPEGKAIFPEVFIPVHKKLESSEFRMMTVRSEGQFNSVIYDEEDAWRGSKERNVVFMNPEDISALGLEPGGLVNLSNEIGEWKGLKCLPFQMARSCVMTYYPESNVLISRTLDPQSKTPAFKNSIVKIQKA